MTGMECLGTTSRDCIIARLRWRSGVPLTRRQCRRTPLRWGGQVEGLKGVGGDGSGGSERSIADGMVGIIFYDRILHDLTMIMNRSKFLINQFLRTYVRRN